MSLPRITSNQEIMDALTPVPDFKSRDDIKPWVIEKMEPRGINLVIERSDASKVVFKCKNIHRKSSSNARLNKNIKVNPKNKRLRSVPDDSCPFRLRVSYSVKHKVWAVNVIKFEHNSSICCNFGDHSPSYSPASSTPGSTKRSWSYTPVSTVSPAFSSPINQFTPSSDYNSYDYINSDFLKKQRKSSSSTYFDSPLYQEIDPLSENLSLLPEDLSDINHFYENTQDLSLINTLPLTNFNPSTTEDSKDLDLFNEFNNEFELNDLKLKEKLKSNNYFKTPVQPKSNQTKTSLSVKIPSSLTEPLILNDDTRPISTDPLNLNLNLHSIQEEVDDDDDPLMHLLNVNGNVTANSNYTLEELENLDKAMGFDANDKLLMSMFQGM